MAAMKKNAAGAENFDAFSAMNPEVLKEGYERMAKGMTNFADFQKGSMEAMMAFAGAYARGVEKAASEQSAFAKAAYEDGVSAMKSTSGAKSAQEALEIQSEYVQSSVEKNLTFATKIADHWSSVAKEAADPVSKRYGEFVEMVQSYRP